MSLIGCGVLIGSLALLPQSCTDDCRADVLLLASCQTKATGVKAVDRNICDVMIPFRDGTVTKDDIQQLQAEKDRQFTADIKANQKYINQFTELTPRLLPLLPLQIPHEYVDDTSYQQGVQWFKETPKRVDEPGAYVAISLNAVHIDNLSMKQNSLSIPPKKTTCFFCNPENYALISTDEQRRARIDCRNEMV